MSDHFLDRPILNPPYEYPTRHWEFEEDGQPTHQIIEACRSAKFFTPVLKLEQRGQSRKISEQTSKF